jgi:hypothetical protein
MMSYLLIGDFKNLVAFLNIVTQRRRSRGQGRSTLKACLPTFWSTPTVLLLISSQRVQAMYLWAKYVNNLKCIVYLIEGIKSQRMCHYQ